MWTCIFEWSTPYYIQSSKALVELTETDAIWPGNSPDERLRNAHVDFVKLCRQNKIRALDPT